MRAPTDKPMPLSSAALARAEVVGPRWRAEPYRILFPLGALLSWAGVLHWLLLATGVWNEYRSAFHATAQIQGFLTCFAVGFLFTFIPRRTGAPSASAWQMAIAIAAPVATTVLAWLEQWVAAQAFWLLDVLVVVGFIVSRLRSAKGRGPLPAGFIWVPASLLACLAAAVAAGVGAGMGPDTMWLHDIGRRVIQQGLFTGLVLGVGSLLLPVLAYGKPPKEKTTGWRLIFNVGAICLFLGSFVIEERVSTRIGFGIRGLVTGAVLVSAGLMRWPTVRGAHRFLAWLAPWFLPLSSVAIVLFPQYPRAGLHLAFIGCFATAVLAVSTHVMLFHAGRAQLLESMRWETVAMAGLLGAALVFRILVDVDPVRFRMWLGSAAACFLAATVAWGALVVPHLLGRPPGKERSAALAGTSPGTPGA